MGRLRAGDRQQVGSREGHSHGSGWGVTMCARHTLTLTAEHLSTASPTCLHPSPPLQAEELVAQTLDAESLRVYRSFPLAVMKADFWRYAVLYARGGLYADVDVNALRPVAQWLPPIDGGASGLPLAAKYQQLTWERCRVVIGLENDVHFCQWVSGAITCAKNGRCQSWSDLCGVVTLV